MIAFCPPRHPQRTFSCGASPAIALNCCFLQWPPMNTPDAPHARCEHHAGWIVIAVLAILTGCSTAPDRGRPESEGRGAALTNSAAAELGRGRASWYGPGFHGKRTAS